jgi:hypothetical protein
MVCNDIRYLLAFTKRESLYCNGYYAAMVKKTKPVGE